MRAWLIFIAVLFGLGLMFSGGDNEPEVKYRVVHDTKTVTKRVEVPVYTIPKSCIDAVSLASRLTDASLNIDNTSTELLDIMSKSRIGINRKSTNDLNDLETQLRQLDAGTDGDVQAIADTRPVLKKLINDCESKVP